MSLRRPTSRVRLWTRKRKPEGASADDTSSTALVPISDVIDHSRPGLLGGASAAMDIDDGDTKEGESKSASSAGASSSPTATNDGFGSDHVEGMDYKSSMSVAPPEQSLDPADNLSADDETVRVTPLEKPAVEQDDWYLLIEEELTEPLEALQLPPLTPVLVEASYYVERNNEAGSTDLLTQWPRAAYHREKTWRELRRRRYC